MISSNSSLISDVQGPRYDMPSPTQITIPTMNHFTSTIPLRRENTKESLRSIDSNRMNPETIIEGSTELNEEPDFNHVC